MHNIKEAEIVLKLKLREHSRGKLHEDQRGLSGSSSLREGVLMMVSRGGWTA
jgi:hypothetical protein